MVTMLVNGNHNNNIYDNPVDEVFNNDEAIENGNIR